MRSYWTHSLRMFLLSHSGILGSLSSSMAIARSLAFFQRARAHARTQTPLQFMSGANSLLPSYFLATPSHIAAAAISVAYTAPLLLLVPGMAVLSAADSRAAGDPQLP